MIKNTLLLPHINGYRIIVTKLLERIVHHLQANGAYVHGEASSFSVTNYYVPFLVLVKRFYMAVFLAFLIFLLDQHDCKQLIDI